MTPVISPPTKAGLPPVAGEETVRHASLSLLQGGRRVKRALFAVAVLLAIGSAVGVAKAIQQQPAPPAPTEDRVGFPDGYNTDPSWSVYYTFDRPDNKQVRVIWAN